MKFLHLLSLAILFAGKSFAQINIPTGRFQVDETRKLIVCNKLPTASEVASDQISFNNRSFNFNAPPATPSYGKQYAINDGTSDYNLFFTQLGIVDITLDGGLTITDIISDSDIKGAVRITNNSESDGVAYDHNSQIQIRVRGASSSTWPKKPYRITLRNQANTANRDDAMLGLRSDKRWLMLAMWNEELKLNSVVSWQLWRDIHKLYYASSEPNALPVIRIKYIEAFINGEYRGIYAFAEDMDRKQLKLMNQANGGELYKGEYWDGPVTFDELVHIPDHLTDIWGGWERRYPDYDLPGVTWNNIYDFSDFAINSEDPDFISGISSKVNMDNIMDYFLFLNITFAEDNRGKNTFLCRYKTGDPYFITPWDLDGTLGYWWHGARVNDVEQILDNGLYRRLLKLNPDGFKDKLARRWFKLREDQFSSAHIFNLVDSARNYLDTNGAYIREYMVYQPIYNDNYPGYQYSNQESALTYIKNWTTDRLERLDTYFEPMLDPTSPLPVKLTQFKVSRENLNAVLTWQTADEINFERFEIEHSANAKNWTRTGVVNAAKLPHYSFLHTNPLKGSNYYRLKLVDKDGSYAYSRIERLNMNEHPDATVIYPIPATDKLYLNDLKEVKKIEIISPSGQQVLQIISNFSNEIDIKNLNQGKFILRLTYESGITVSKNLVIVR